MVLSVRRALRWLVPLTLLALVIAACEVDDDVDEAIDEEDEAEEDDVDPADEPDEEEEEEDEEEPAEEDEPDDVEVADFTYEMGMFEDMDVDSYWTYLDDTDVWTAYVVSHTPCQLYALEPPNYTVTPELATEDWPEPEEDGDAWVVELDIHEGIEWSDGEPITAHDMEFTWNAVLDIPLGGQWVSFYEPEPMEAGITTDIEAVDDTTVRIEFAEEPGLGTWPMNVALAPIMPEHHWGDLVDEADDPEDFLAESGQGSPVCGAWEFAEWEEGAFAASDVNENYFLEGTQYTHYEDGTVDMVNEDLGIDGNFGEGEGEGDVLAEYTVGPYAEEVLYTLYGDASVAVSSLVEGEVPFLLTGPGIEEAAQDEIIDDEDTEAVVNPDYGMQYLGFNFEREPMNDLAFRQAVATVIDREFITDTVMGGSALPLYTFIPSGNEAWFDDETGGSFEEDWQYEDMAERLDDAVAILEEAGYSWEGEEPGFDEEAGDVVFGEGLTNPDGEVIDEVELIHPTAGYDPLRNTAGLHIADFIEQLGVEVNAEATEFGQLLEQVDAPDNLDYDMVILGWSLGNVAYPDYYHAFWNSESPVNNTAFAHDEFDEASNAFVASSSIEEAYDVLWEDMEPILQEQLPYVPLFDTPTVEGYRPDEVQFPYTEVLSGVENVLGQPSLVQPAAE
ncbi:ABC transporter substrate-binding protein [Egibacter rhizosphaerae]|uniref:ABC transporter substrate-binding protein n=1 Tax=Egibacter rhizosphaerae TaxID=1670831 RepID=A0A411YKP2_9ACTN|nr:ABC transporter substrate-binding protein [Egibacter rhizosphaerae]QBI21750.1 ABC transporter substrate-binding protein [Egibacter rhizosphaerae]